MDKPKNPYTPGTMYYRLFEMDLSEMTLDQIAETMHTTSKSISDFLCRTKNKCDGYQVPYRSLRKLKAKPQYEQAGISLLDTIQPYKKKKPKVPAKCDTCANVECRARWRATCWTNCGGHRSKSEEKRT